MVAMAADSWQWVLLMTAGACALVALLIPATRRLAIRCGVIDRPSATKLHGTVTPYLGGIPMAVAAVALAPFLPGWRTQAAVVLGAALLVSTVGLVDDLRSLSPLPRVAVEVLAATIVFAAGVHVRLFGAPFDWLLTVLWLVALTNAFNLLDNMDGCAGIIATITALALFTSAALQGQVLVGGLSALVAGACVGFLVHNWHPARIFMGDAGSLFLGFLLATIALMLRFPVPRLDGICAVVLFSGPALFDTTLVVLSRLRENRPVLQGGTDHTSHRLLNLGLPTPAVALLCAVGAAGCSGLGLAVGRGVLDGPLTLAAVAGVGGSLLVALLRLPAYRPALPAAAPAEASA
jgi:UDP-GlcNAc:undecaprenyl-phosphate GlcNAc-1-phosphate transferase